MILAEFDKPIYPNDWQSDRAGVYKAVIYTPSLSFNINGEHCFYDGIPQVDVALIRLVRVGLTDLVLVDTNAELDDPDNGNCFFYEVNKDSGINTLYCNFADSIGTPFRPPFDLSVKVGIIVGYSMGVDKHHADGAFYSNILYEPRIKKIPTISRKRDNLTYGVLRKSETTVTFFNNDGYFDNADFEGSYLRLYYLDSGDEIAEGTLIDTGIVNKTAKSNDEYNVTITSKRESQNVNVDFGKIPAQPTIFDLSSDTVTNADGSTATTIISVALSVDYTGQYIITKSTQVVSTTAAGVSSTTTAINDERNLGHTVDDMLVLGTSTTVTQGTDNTCTSYNTCTITSDTDGNLFKQLDTTTIVAYTNGTTERESGTTIDAISMTQRPIYYGVAEKVEPIPIKNDLNTVTYLFCATDTNDIANGVVHQPQKVSAMWQQNDDGTKTSLLSHATFDYSEGTFTISTDYAYESGSYQTIYMTFTGYHRSTYDQYMGYDLTGLEIQCDLLLLLCDYKRKYYNYDIETLNNEIEKQKRQGRKLSLKYDDANSKLMDEFSKICRDTDTLFLELPDGRFSARVDAEITDVVLEVAPQELLAKPEYSIDLSNLITSITIKYGAVGGVDQKAYKDTSTEATIKETYHLTNATTVESCLYDIASAQSKVTHTLDKALSPTVTTTFKVPLTKYNAGLPVIASILAPRDRNNDVAVWEVTGTDKDIIANTLSISVSKLSDANYAGYEQGTIYGAAYLGSRYYGVTLSNDD